MTISTIGFYNPLNDWAEKDRLIDEREAEFQARFDAAERLGDAASIELARRELEELRSARAKFDELRQPVVDGIAAMRRAEAGYQMAVEVDQAGSLDAKVAAKNAERVAVTGAALRHWLRVLPGLIASANGTRERVAWTASHSVAKEVVDESLDLAKKLLEYRDVDNVAADAEAVGKGSKGEHVAWWPVAELLATEALRRRLADEVPQYSGVRDPNTGRFIKDHRTEYPELPTEDDLQQVFAARRRAFETMRKKLLEQAAALTAAAGG